MEFLQVARCTKEGIIELPVEEDGTLLLSTLQSQFPDACGLKYLRPDYRAIRGVRLNEGRFYPPSADSGWGLQIYFCVLSNNNNKRKSEDNVDNSTAKRRRTETCLRCANLVVDLNVNMLSMNQAIVAIALNQWRIIENLQNQNHYQGFRVSGRHNSQPETSQQDFVASRGSNSPSGTSQQGFRASGESNSPPSTSQQGFGAIGEPDSLPDTSQHGRPNSPPGTFQQGGGVLSLMPESGAGDGQQGSYLSSSS